MSSPRVVEAATIADSQIVESDAAVQGREVRLAIASFNSDVTHQARAKTIGVARHCNFKQS
jgi:hypothetical protein